MSQQKEKNNCCGCQCCDSTKIAEFLRHVAQFFEK